MPAPQTVHTPSLPIVTGVPFPWGAERYVQHFSFQKSFAETHVAQTLQINFFSLRLLLTLSSVDWNDVLYLPGKNVSAQLSRGKTSVFKDDTISQS